MIEASLRGRLGKTPVERQTKDGWLWVTASIAVDVARDDRDESVEWFNLAAFGTAAEVLLAHEGGELINAFGRLTRSTYTAKDGTERTSWQLTAGQILSARSTLL